MAAAGPMPTLLVKIGRILGKTSLDELPQLFNILNGPMSLIGPRPMFDYQVPRCVGEEVLRFEMRPGLTGLAQVKGRNCIIWKESNMILNMSRNLLSGRIS